MRVLVGVFVAALAVLLPLSADLVSPVSASAVGVVCSESVDPASCDSDGDRITDVLEKQICGSSTCATGREDADRDGIPDWSEYLVCGDARCADPGIDTDKDGIPDFAEIYVCGSVSCSTGREDLDEDTIADWIEFVICGDRTCANGHEDYNNDGISDAVALAACVVAFDVVGPSEWARPVVSGLWTGTGMKVELFVWWPIIVGAALFLIGMTALGVALWKQRKRDEERADAIVDASDMFAELTR